MPVPHVIQCMDRSLALGRGTQAQVDDADRWDADRAITVLYCAHYRQLVRIAALLLRDFPAAEEIAQDAFVGLHRNWSRLRDANKAAAYLRQSTVNGARSARRRTATAARFAPTLAVAADTGHTGHTAHTADPAAAIVERSAVLVALAALPDRQREVLVLRYYGDLSETDIAHCLGISRGAVKTHASRGIAALRPTLEQVR
jgi:RNA polymerase sigma-70 factor (sigma-E family)